ncbi:MAG TPA: restriction endonuclease subunit S [Longimicrobium sp.]|nr:restriction endonuclease subunit S [Longimicrobium sp.]
MPSFVTAPLADVLARVIDHRGRTPKKLGGDFVSSGVRVLSALNVQEGRIDDSDTRYVTEEMWHRWMPEKLHSGDVLLTSEAPLGQTAYLASDDPLCLGQRLFALRADERRLHGRFLYYYLRSEIGQSGLAARATGTTVVGIRQSELMRVEVPLPPLRDQQAIAAVLGILDDKIEQNRRTTRAMEELSRATFKAWFVDFEPVKSKAAGATSFPGLPPAAFTVLPDRLTDSPLGPVPQGWDTPVFSEIVKQSSERVGTTSVPAYSSTNEGLRPRDEQFKKDLAKSFAKNLLIRRGDLVFGNSREILNFGVMYDPAGSVSQVYKVFRPQSKVVTSRYIEMMIRERSAFYRQIIRSTTRDNQGIMADFFLQLPLLVPPREFRDAYAAVEKPVREMIDHLQTESAKLATLRDYLLPRLLSGRVRVRDVVESGTGT